MGIDKPRIRDIPSMSKTLREMEQFDSFRRLFPLLSPFLRLFGVETGKIRDALKDLPRLRKEAEELSTIPDRFNDMFAERGWIMHADMSLDAAKEALSVAEEAGVDEAENVLVASYAPDEVEWMLRRMHSVAAFRPRMRLAELALRDYADGRYHASIPVVLAQLDGMVSQVHAERRGFFAEDGDMTAWDSIAAHETGLNTLALLFKQGRRTLNISPISIPYRHGILHGWDVVYDSVLVAAKSWAALFATREWALKAERGELKEPVPEPEPSLWEILDKVQKNKATRERVKQWRPRELLVGRDMPVSGRAVDYEESSPERAIVEYLELWQKQNYGHMARYLDIPFSGGDGISPQRVREALDDCRLEGFRLIQVSDEAPTVTEISLELELRREDDLDRTLKTFRLVFWGDDVVVMRGDPRGRWRIINWYV